MPAVRPTVAGNGFAKPTVRKGEGNATRKGNQLLALIHVGVGVAIAASHDYFKNIEGWRGVLSAIFAIFLWPLILV